MKTKKIILGLFLLMFVISCRQEIKPDDFLNKERDFKLIIHRGIKYSSYSSTTEIINKDSEKITKLKDLLTSNLNGWKSSIDSWATPDISLIGNDFRLLIFEKFVVIGFKDKTGKPKQYTKQIDESNFDFLIERK